MKNLDDYKFVDYLTVVYPGGGMVKKLRMRHKITFEEEVITVPQIWIDMAVHEFVRGIEEGKRRFRDDVKELVEVLGIGSSGGV